MTGPPPPLQPHVLMVSFPVQGHVIPLMELAHRVVDHGVKVTFVNTEIIVSSLADHKDVLDDRIRLVAIPDGLEDEERRIPGKLSQAVFGVMPGKVEELIREMNAREKRVTCLIADQSLGWAQEVAGKLGIRRVAFLTAAAASLVMAFNIPSFIQDGIIGKDGTVIKKQMVQLAPSMPLLNSAEFVWARLGNSTTQKFVFQGMLQNNQVTKLAEWLLCNSTHDLEPGAFSLAPEIVPIGPLLATNRPENSAGQFIKQEDGDSTSLNWLDKQPPASVVYVAFGSTSVHSKAQIEELARGLALSDRRFLWVVPPEVEKSANLEGILQSTQGQIVRRAPQQKVLSHPAIACFVTHCGWNSVVESLGSGVPMLCLPYFADQFTNRSYVCDIWQVGLGFRGDESGMITREEIKEKMDELLGHVSYKERALHLRETMMNSASEGGSSHGNFANFIAWLKA